MQLIYAKPSPYSRKARVTVIEKGLAGQVEDVIVSPMEDPAALLGANPLGKVPALEIREMRYRTVQEVLADTQIKQVITTGLGRNYYEENLEELTGSRGGKPSHLHIGAYPLPVEVLPMARSHVESLLRPW